MRSVLARLAICFASISSLWAASLTNPEPLPQLRTLFLSGQLDSAREQVKLLLQADPNDARSWALLGDILYRESKFPDAEQAYRGAVLADRHYARGHWGLGRLEMLASRRLAARDHIATAYQLDPRDADIVLSYADFVQDPGARIVLLRNFLSLASPASHDRAQLEDATAQLEITKRLGQLDFPRLASPYQPYRLKLTGYFPNGGPQTGVIVLVSLNGGKPLRLILDSGADGIFVSGRRARDVSLERLTADRVAGFGSSGDEKAYLGLARHVNVGTLELEDCLIHVTEGNSFPGADGAIGLNIFEKFLIQIDPASRSLNLTPLPDVTRDSSDHPEMVHAYRVGHFMLLKASIDGQPNRFFLLDTGASFSATNGPGSSTRTGSAAIGLRGAGGSVDGALGRRPMRLTVEGRQLVDRRPVELDLTELSHHEGVEISGIIGYPPLGKSTLTINYRDGLIQFGQPSH